MCSTLFVRWVAEEVTSLQQDGWYCNAVLDPPLDWILHLKKKDEIQYKITIEEIKGEYKEEETENRRRKERERSSYYFGVWFDSVLLLDPLL